MKYLNGKEIKLGDIVYWRNSAPKDEGVVVCLIDDLKFLSNYDYTALKKNGGGIMIFFHSMGLVQIERDDKNIDIEFSHHSDYNDSIDFIKNIPQ